MEGQGRGFLHVRCYSKKAVFLTGTLQKVRSLREGPLKKISKVRYAHMRSLVPSSLKLQPYSPMVGPFYSALWVLSNQWGAAKKQKGFDVVHSMQLQLLQQEDKSRGGKVSIES